MGLYDFGEYLFGSIVLMNIMLIAFGGLTDTGFILNDGIPSGVHTINTININQLDQNGTFSGTPYAVANNTTSIQNSNFFESLGFNKLPAIVQYITMALFGFAIAINYIGLPGIIAWPLITAISIFMLFYAGFFFLRIVGSLRGGGSV